ncbi:GPP34 family phosphoprotein [Streptomyces sp. NPDC096310]|uniref:GPP34 family phosphoprotein n=1 Tax=Streptomyces sp. NPDC096310 TaxID=3366082 RepID=UPI0038286C7A
MTTSRDLLTVTLDVGSGRAVERGDLSLVLAGAEVIDLIEVQALTLEDERIVPGARWTLSDRLLDEAAAALVREAPYEAVEDWLWRRGRGLADVYFAALEAGGQLTRQRHRWIPVDTGRTALADSPERRHAARRWAAGEPVLVALAGALGIGEPPGEDAPEIADDSVVTVLAAVNDAVMELEAVRQRRAIEDAAFDNIWRGP